MEEKEVRKTTAKRAVRKTTTKVTPRKTAVRKTATPSVRKAPARAVSAARPRSSKATLVMFVICLVVIGASVAIGYSDKGPIDVTNTIATRKQNATPEEQDTFKTIPVQQGQNNVVNGGLVGTGKSAPVSVPEAENTATSSATSSDPTATSTEEMETQEAQDEEAVEVDQSDQEEPAEEAIMQ